MQENDGLSSQLRQIVEENRGLENAIRNLQQELEGSRRGVNEYEYKITQVTQEYQSKISTLETRMKQTNNDNEELRRRLQELSDINRKLP